MTTNGAEDGDWMKIARLLRRVKKMFAVSVQGAEQKNAFQRRAMSNFSPVTRDFAKFCTNNKR